VRSWAHWLIFVGLGPLIGVVIVIVGIFFQEGWPDSHKAALLLLMGLMFSHLLGSAPALAAAFVVWGLRRLRLPLEWLWAGLVGGAAGLFVFEMTIQLVLGFPPFSDRLLPLSMICIIPSWACWYLSTRVPKKAQSPTP
jgi:hypothetical protein